MTDPSDTTHTETGETPPAHDSLKDSWGEVGAKFGDAFEQLGAALRELGRKITGVVNDDELRDQAKQAAHTFDGALTKTVDTVGDQVEGLVRRVTKRKPSEPIDTAAEPIDTSIVDADVVVEHDQHDEA